MIQGIPYFGEETQKISEKIQTSKIKYSKRYSSLYDLVLSHIDKKIVVVIDNKWLSWLNDIAFNYKDHLCYIPYFTYEWFSVKDKSYRSNNKGHLVLKDNTLQIRYNYKYNKLSLDNTTEGLSIILYNIETQEKYRAYVDKWINEQDFDIDKLYNLYINSCFKEDDFLYNKHEGGYHYIYKSPKEFKNKERQIREENNLPTYSIEHKFEKDYRDVRNYKYDEVIQKVGLIDSIELYKIRRLKFESYLYCLLREDLKPSNSNVETDENKSTFIKQWDKLGITKEHIKYGDRGIKLIFKSYWLNNYKQPKKKTWSRFQN